HPVAEPDRLLRLDRGEVRHPVLALLYELVDPVLKDVLLRREAVFLLDLHLDPEALRVEAVLVALLLAEHRVEALERILVRAPPRVVHPHRIFPVNRPVDERPPPLRRFVATDIAPDHVALPPP